MTPAAASAELLFGGAALSLAPRSLDAPHAARGDTVRVAFRPAALAAGDRAALERLATAPLDLAAGEAVLVAPRGELARLAAERPALAPLLAAHDAAARPPAPPRLMGVINVTPDSFSDGGRFLDPERAVEHGRRLVAEGAALLDVGGESTRPGAQPVPEAEELARVAPVVERLARDAGVPISIDTTKAAVARRALDLGAQWVNDISAGASDPAMLPLVARRGCRFVAMHMRGTPRDMQRDPRYGDPVAEVLEELRARVASCLAAGIDPARIAVDPGIGFGKRLEHNLELLRRLGELRSLGLPVLVGVSRKSFIGQLAGERTPDGAAPPRIAPSRIGGTAAAVTACVLQGAEILRVHDAAAMAEAARVASALRRPAGCDAASAP